MGPDAKPKHGGRVKRTSAVVRAWDGPNSRIAFEMDLDQMPWGPFEALGKKVTVLIPDDADHAVDTHDGKEASHIERALRHVEHAAEKCAEFAQLGNGSDQLWSRSLETWEWLRNFLMASWTETEEQEAAGATERDDAADPRLPGMPGAAATLEVAANALRQTPLASWRDAVGTFNPDAPTREEAIQTLLGVARLLSHAGAQEGHPGPEAPPAAEPVESGEPPSESGDSERRDSEGGEARRDGDPEAGARDPENTGELSYDYAAGYDEGYQMGRKVGRALATRDRSGPRR